MVHRIPVVKARSGTKPPSSLAGFLEKQFQSCNSAVDLGPYSGGEIPAIQRHELTVALKQMARGKCLDRAGVSLEMLLYGGEALHSCLLGYYNSMITTGEFDDSWKETLFVMLRKSGDLGDPANWRPIAILRICYKLFARIVHNRIRNTLDEQQADDADGLQVKTRHR